MRLYVRMQCLFWVAVVAVCKCDYTCVFVWYIHTHTNTAIMRARTHTHTRSRALALSLSLSLSLSHTHTHTRRHVCVCVCVCVCVNEFVTVYDVCVFVVRVAGGGQQRQIVIKSSIQVCNFFFWPSYLYACDSFETTFSLFFY
jgi:hypothetical protein